MRIRTQKGGCSSTCHTSILQEQVSCQNFYYTYDAPATSMLRMDREKLFCVNRIRIGRKSTKSGAYIWIWHLYLANVTPCAFTQNISIWSPLAIWDTKRGSEGIHLICFCHLFPTIHCQGLHQNFHPSLLSRTETFSLSTFTTFLERVYGPLVFEIFVLVFLKNICGEKELFSQVRAVYP